MGLLDNYTGLGMSPRPTPEHQLAMGDLHAHIREILIDGNQWDNYRVMTECVVNFDDLNSPAPDLVIYDWETKEPILIIEITNTAQLKNIIKKVDELFTEYPSIEEAFIYNYETEEWHNDESYSEIFDIDFDDAF